MPIATNLGAQHPRSAITVDFMGPNLDNVPSIMRKTAVIFYSHYNEVRPHSSLGYLTPREFINQPSKVPNRGILRE